MYVYSFQFGDDEVIQVDVSPFAAVSGGDPTLGSSELCARAGAVALQLGTLVARTRRYHAACVEWAKREHARACASAGDKAPSENAMRIAAESNPAVIQAAEQKDWAEQQFKVMTEHHCARLRWLERVCVSREELGRGHRLNF